ncbi:ankyrin repeat domain-containing protein 60-like [Anguilla rostrata]|uniref:ankyrin repeat domain-containing protein 60-like n=1 Tax=Anguilla rostrata TaxID=7938 RepID=UPI0030D62CD5
MSKPSAITSSRQLSLRASNVEPSSSRSRQTWFSVRVRLHDTGELFLVPKCSFSMKIRELKNVLELVAGIPTDFQRLCYLDKGVLMDETSFRYNGIVPGSTLSLMIWPYSGWPELVKAAAAGSVNTLKSVVFKQAPFSSSKSNEAGSLAASWLSHRLFSALFISVHRGHLPAVRFLLQNGADVQAQTPRGRAALHAAASRGQADCMRELLAKGAELHLQDREGLTAIGVAKRLGQGRSVGLLFLWDWQQRAKGLGATPPLQEGELFAHQCFDSCLKTWLCGPEAQQYRADLQERGRPRGPAGEGQLQGALQGRGSSRGPAGEGQLQEPCRGGAAPRALQGRGSSRSPAAEGQLQGLSPRAPLNMDPRGSQRTLMTRTAKSSDCKKRIQQSPQTGVHIVENVTL